MVHNNLVTLQLVPYIIILQIVSVNLLGYN
jgi:hypothetical protein